MTAITHFFPPSRSADSPTQVSIIVPTLNERITVGAFIDWCRLGLQTAEVDGQILIVDSSTDDTAEIALAHGAEVLKVPKRGLGRAYIDAIPYARGELFIMGDADLTYDFRDLRPFIAAWREGAEFIMGSRFKGTIEQGAMPSLHRYFGTPLTTWILNSIYGSHFSDIHCGMRAITRTAFQKIDLRSQSWEYASEMVIKAIRLKIRTNEVPIHFYKDQQGRVSHHKRIGWLSPWIAGWINLKVMLVYAADKLLIPIGALLFGIGLPLCLLLRTGPREIFGIGFQVHWLLLSISCCLMGFGLIQLGIFSRFVEGLESERPTRFLAFLTYNRGIAISLAMAVLGLVQLIDFAVEYIRNDWKLLQISYQSLFAIYLLMLSIQLFGFTLSLEMCWRRFPTRVKSD